METPSATSAITPPVPSTAPASAPQLSNTLEPCIQLFYVSDDHRVYLIDAGGEFFYPAEGWKEMLQHPDLFPEEMEEQGEWVYFNAVITGANGLHIFSVRRRRKNIKSSPCYEFEVQFIDDLRCDASQEWVDQGVVADVICGLIAGEELE